MYEKIYDHRHSIIFAVLVIAVIAWYMFGGESGGSTGNNNDVQGTVHGVMGDNRELGKSLDKAVGHIGAAEKELERAAEANQRAERILSEGQERADTGSGIVKDRHILDDIPTKEEFQEVIEKVKLTPRQLEILELRFIRHLLNYEIADRLGLSEKTVVRDLRKSYRMIHEILNKQNCEKALQK